MEIERIWNEILRISILYKLLLNALQSQLENMQKVNADEGSEGKK